jgi:hypothetical protein
MPFLLLNSCAYHYMKNLLIRMGAAPENFCGDILQCKGAGNAAVARTCFQSLKLIDKRVIGSQRITAHHFRWAVAYYCGAGFAVAAQSLSIVFQVVIAAL